MVPSHRPCSSIGVACAVLFSVSLISRSLAFIRFRCVLRPSWKSAPSFLVAAASATAARLAAAPPAAVARRVAAGFGKLVMDISDHDRERIAAAIRAAEAKTSGEIVCVLAQTIYMI
jgi:hypothetical protein